MIIFITTILQQDIYIAQYLICTDCYLTLHSKLYILNVHV